MSAPTEFSLRFRIRQIIETSVTADPKVIAEEVLSSITTKEASAALAECLPEYVRVCVLQARSRTPRSAGPGKSWKREAAKAYADKLLRQRVDTVGDGSGWKFLAECDAEDLHQVAAKRREAAEDLVQTAAWFEKIAGLLDEHEAATVSDLPADVLTSIATNGEVAA